MELLAAAMLKMLNVDLALVRGSQSGWHVWLVATVRS